jgi:hypothetical protein
MEFSSAAGFPNIDQGRIIRIANGVAEEIVSGLNVPTAWLWTATKTFTSAISEPRPARLDASCALQILFRVNFSPRSKSVNRRRWSVEKEQTTTTDIVTASEAGLGSRLIPVEAIHGCGRDVQIVF